MANYANLKAAINANIKTNDNEEITGAILNAQLIAMVNSLGAGYQFVGIATPSTDPGTPDQNVYYVAAQAGTYTNFGGLVVNDGEVAVLMYNGTWSKAVTGAATSSKLNAVSQRIMYEYTGVINSTNTGYRFEDLFLNSGEKYYVKLIDGDVGSFVIGGTSLVSRLTKGEWVSFVVPSGVSGIPATYIGANVQNPSVIRFADAKGVMAELELMGSDFNESLDDINEFLDEITDINYVKVTDISIAGSGSIWVNNLGVNPSISQYQRHTNKIPVTPGQRVSFYGGGSVGSSSSLASFSFFDNTTDPDTWNDLTGFLHGIVGESASSVKEQTVPEGAAYVVVSSTPTFDNGRVDNPVRYVPAEEPQTIVITADRDENSDADFTGLNAIADAINSITDASFAKRYIVHVRGEFHFTSPSQVTMLHRSEYSVIDMKPFIDVEGEGADRTIIFVDFPANAAFPTGFAYNDYQPVFFCGTGGSIRNMKIIGKNCRYAFHIEVEEDNSLHGGNTINIDNCEVISLGAPDYATDGHMGAFGTGMIPGTVWNISDCKIINEEYDTAFGLHTPLNPYEEVGCVNFKGCTFKGKIVLSNYQVNNNTLVNMIGCTFNGAKTPSITYSYYNNRSSAVLGDYTTQLFNGNEQKLLYGSNAAYNIKGAVLRIVSNSTGTTSKIRFDRTASAFGLIIGDASLDVAMKTIYGWDTQYGYIFRDGGVGLSGQAFGTPDIDESSSTASSSLGKKLGNCTSSNKVLIINVDGTDYTVTFNEDYRTKDNAYVIGKINEVIGSVATADVFCPGKLYYPNINGLCEVESGDSTAILKGMGVVFDKNGKMVKAKNTDGYIDGICLDDTSLGQTGRVIRGGFIHAHNSNQWFAAKDTLDYLPSVRFGKTLGIDPDNDGQFKQNTTPALLRCKSDCLAFI